MKHISIDGFHIVVTENAEEKEKFKNALRNLDEPTAPQAQTSPIVSPRPDPANPDVAPLPVPNPSPTPNPLPPPPPPPPPPPEDPPPPPPGSEIFSPLPQSGVAIPTFHCMGLYLNLSTAPPSSLLPWSGPKVWVRFRKANLATWSQGFPLWYDQRTTGTGLPYVYNCRGSVVNLTPNTKYVFEFGLGATYETVDWSAAAGARHATGTTWSETFVEDGAATTVPVGGTYEISPGMGGSLETGYKVFDGTASYNTRTGGETGAPQGVDRSLGGTQLSGVIWVRDSYVIIRRVTVRKGPQSSIYIADGVTDVVIDDCDLADMAWAPRNTRGGAWAWRELGGVKLAGNNSRIVIQKTKIHDPHRGTWTWDVAHPEGAVGVFVESAGQQNVIRYNEIYADANDSGQPSESNPWWEDCVSGNPNFSTTGCPGADSDIYGNILKHAVDDCLEAEGGGRNVRIWNNYPDHNSVGIANAVVHFGPMYIWRNVSNRQRFRYGTPGTPVAPDNDVSDSSIFKNYGTVSGFGGGKKFYFHNTALQTPGSEHSPAQTFPLGAGQGNVGPMNNTMSRNNILHVKKSGSDSVRVSSSGGTDIGSNTSFANELYNGGLTNVTIVNGVSGTPTYKVNHGPLSVPAFGGNGTGNYQLDTGSLGLNAGAVLPNFNDASSHQPASGVPDIGAHESGAPAMKFGISP